MDAYLQEALPEVEVALLRPDSSMVSVAVSKYQMREETDMHGNKSVMSDRFSGASFKVKVPSEGDYILCFTLKGYETKYADVSVKFKRHTMTYDAGDFVMFPEAKKLNEITVTATRIKMYNKGDTLVYNADAFQTANGSMLDDLVRQLPGVELRDGRIYAQGKFVESILISGKDFFHGDPQAALSNLPAYIVSKLKFYDKSGELSETMGRDMHDKSYVMDVNLKRDYHGMWLLNPSFGYGTRGRYEGMAFLMRFDDRQSFTISADLNNIGKVREANDLCTVSNDYNDRRLTNQYVKSTYHIEPSSKFRLSVNGDYKHQSARMENETSTETYLTSGNLFTREQNRQKGGLTEMGVDLMTSLRPMKGRYIKLDYSLGYSRQDMNSQERAAQFNTNPDNLLPGNALDSAVAEKTPIVIAPIINYRLLQKALQNGHTLRQMAQAEAHFALGANLLKMIFSWDGDRESMEQKQHYDLEHPNDDQSGDDWRNRYRNTSNRHHSYKVGTEFFRKFIDTGARSGQLSLAYNFSYRYDSNLDPLYRLDQLPGWGMDDGRELGALPSTRDSLQLCIDLVNSFDWSDHLRKHSLSAKWLVEWQLKDSTWMKAEASLPIVHSLRSLSYNRGGKHYPVTTHSWLLNPTLALSYMPKSGDREGYRKLLAFNYSMSTEEPHLLYLPAIRDDADPLNISFGNAHLKNTQRHSLSLNYKQYNPNRYSSLLAKVSYEASCNDVAMSSVYNISTGVRAYRPTNVSGNYLLSTEISFSSPLNKKQTWFFSNSVQGSLAHLADLNSTETFSERNTIVNTRVGDELSLTFAPKSSLRITAKAGGTWSRISSGAVDFKTLNIGDLKYALNAEIGLPWNLHMSSDLTVKSRYGYSNGSYDRTEWLWNGQLSRSWIDGNLTLSLSMNDILHSRNRISSELNVWGRVEHYTRLYTPAYLMLHASYRFSF